MPNWVCNRVCFKTETDMINVINKYCTQRIDKNEMYNEKQAISIMALDELVDDIQIYFDFNKVLPIPETLNINSSTSETICYELYLKMLKHEIRTYLGSITDFTINLILKQLYGYDYCEWDKIFSAVLYAADKKSVGKYLKYKEIAELMAVTNEIYNNTLSKYAVYSDNYLDKTFMSLSSDERCRIFIFAVELGKVVYYNYNNYGYSDWYGWCCKNWGTKWDACETYICKNDLYIEFNTAWNTPKGIFKLLAKQNPTLKFETLWADEDIGSNTGYGSAKEGTYIETYYDNQSVKAYDAAANLWGID